MYIPKFSIKLNKRSHVSINYRFCKFSTATQQFQSDLQTQQSAKLSIHKPTWSFAPSKLFGQVASRGLNFRIARRASNACMKSENISKWQVTSAKRSLWANVPMRMFGSIVEYFVLAERAFGGCLVCRVWNATLFLTAVSADIGFQLSGRPNNGSTQKNRSNYFVISHTEKECVYKVCNYTHRTDNCNILTFVLK